VGIFLSWIIFSFVVGWVWQQRGLSYGTGLVLSLLLSPLIGFIIGMVKTPTPEQTERAALAAGGVKKCPFCAEMIKAEAVICRFCGRDLPTPEERQSTPAPPRPPRASNYERIETASERAERLEQERAAGNRRE
jgi:hypothetical protein